MLEGDRAVKDLAHASSLCGACKDVCPVRIDIPRMLVELREHLDRGRIAPWPERALFGLARRLMESPALFRAATRGGRWLQRPFVRDDRLRWLPLFFGKWTATRDLPRVAARTFSERWKDLG
jgi:L-lactate dehydrogenase complex protein LldF